MIGSKSFNSGNPALTIGLPIEDLANPPAPDGPPDMEALLKVCARYDIYFLET